MPPLRRDRSDWLGLGLVSLGLLLLMLLPAAAGVWRQTPDLAYTGARWFSPQDAPVYYSWIRQASEGEWLLTNRFTSEPQGLGTLNWYWTLVGKFAAPVGLTPPVAFALARLASALLLLFVVDTVARKLLPSRRDQRWALVLAAFASGAGFLLLPWLSFSVNPATGVPAVPVDLWIPEASLVHTALHSGHLATAAALVALSLVAWGRGLASGRPLAAALAGLWAALLFSFHPFEVVLLASVVVASAAVVGAWQRTWRPWLLAVVWGLVASPPILYHAYSLIADPLIAARAAQNVTLSPPLWTLPWALGGLGVLAAVGAIDRWQRGSWREPTTLVLLLWASLQVAVVYAPLPFQRRLLIGLPIALALLAAPVAAEFSGQIITRFRARGLGWGVVVLAFLLVLTPSTGWMLWHDLQLVARRHPLVFVDRQVLVALQWLSEQTPPSAVVLALPEEGGRIPAWAGRTTVIGHPIETVQAYEKARQARAYFAGALPDADRWLAQQRVTHVVAVRPKLPPSAGLTELFSNDAAVIYAVAPPAAPGPGLTPRP